MGRMHLKKRKSYSKLYILIIILFIIGLYLYFIKFNFNRNEKYVNSLINNTMFGDNKNGLPKYDKIKYPVMFIDKALAYQDLNNYQSFKYMHNNYPMVYIYNTHPIESYKGIKKYDMDNTVVLAAKLLQNKLNKKNIITILEEKSATKYLNRFNLNYDQSYVATRSFLKERLKQNKFKLIIDLHRDAIPKSLSTTVINNMEYAKIMFVQNVNLKSNYNLAIKLNNIMIKNNPSISRGIYKLQVSKLNQDVDGNVILIELGANNNTFDEVERTINLLADGIEELLK